MSYSSSQENRVILYSCRLRLHCMSLVFVQLFARVYLMCDLRIFGIQCFYLTSIQSRSHYIAWPLKIWLGIFRLDIVLVLFRQSLS